HAGAVHASRLPSVRANRPVQGRQVRRPGRVGERRHVPDGVLSIVTAMAAPGAGMLLVDITSRGAGLFGSRTAVRPSDGAQTYRQLHAGVCGLIDLLATAGGVGRNSTCVA